MEIRPLNPAEEEVWRALVRMMIMLPRTLDEDLQQGAGMSLTHYIVLMRLSEAPDRRLRMSDLAGQAELSPSRMSRIVDNLQRHGLVSRTSSCHDGRANLATLTEEGMAALRQAWPAHLASVRSIVIDHLGETQLPAIAEVIAGMLEAAQRPMPLRAYQPAPPAD